MKRLVCILLLFTALQVDAALTVTARGGTNNGTSQTTLALVPNATIVAGSLGVALFVFTNSGASAGSIKIFTQTTFNDSVGNTWTRRVNALYDPGAANAGIEIAAYTAPITTQITTSDNVTVTVSTATTQKVGYLIEVTGASGTPTFVSGAAISDGLTSGQSGTAVSITSSSITTGDAILAWNGQRDNTVPSAFDTDTTNGSWAAAVAQGIATAVRLVTQNKVVTGTGTQTWDITLVNPVAWECGWVQVREATSANDTTDGFFLWQ